MPLILIGIKKTPTFKKMPKQQLNVLERQD
jgi:hypothetical protein